MASTGVTFELFAVRKIHRQGRPSFSSFLHKREGRFFFKLAISFKESPVKVPVSTVVELRDVRTRADSQRPLQRALAPIGGAK